jgi:hypothetical protein
MTLNIITLSKLHIATIFPDIKPVIVSLFNNNNSNSSRKDIHHQVLIRFQLTQITNKTIFIIPFKITSMVNHQVEFQGLR